jgi:L-threonylcarbamoyladenylate synthase
LKSWLNVAQGFMSPVSSQSPFDQAQLNAAVDALTNGQLVGLPTETVYGLGADATNPVAIAAIFQTKSRPRFNPLISHVPDLASAQVQGYFSPLALKLAQAFWPGPLTLVVPRLSSSTVCDLACAGLDTIALRVPSHDMMRDVLKGFGRPIAAPSANVSGRPSPTTAQHVQDEFGQSLAMVLDGGPCTIGLESAVVAVTDDRATLLRLGGLAREAIEAVSGPLLLPSQADHAAPASPGMILRHYAPKAPMRLYARRCHKGEILIGFGPMVCDLNLSPTGNLAQAAANLFAMLRAADAQNPDAIVVATIPNQGLGEAINDRLLRAARG